MEKVSWLDDKKRKHNEEVFERLGTRNLEIERSGISISWSEDIYITM